MINRIVKNLLPVALKHRLISYVRAKVMHLPAGPRSFVFLAADYGNIGDVAITEAQLMFLRQHAPEHHTVSIPVAATREVIRSIQRQITSKDIVTIIGGGNMGVMYPEMEELRQLIIRLFPRNRIICFPQTLDWDDSIESDRALQRMVSNYGRHHDLHIFAREKLTHAKLIELFKYYPDVNIGYAPDTVMSATAASFGAEDCAQPSGILRCLRADKESALSGAQKAALDKVLVETGYEVEHTDTYVGGSQLDKAFCATLLKDKLSQFRAAKLVVTDRLHGMIFCLLAGTPCLVLSNSNHKIRQTWIDWLQADARFVIFVEPDQFNEIPNIINKLLVTPHGSINEQPLDARYYRSLQQVITNAGAM